MLQHQCVCFTHIYYRCHLKIKTRTAACLSRRFSWQSVPFPSGPGTTDCFWYVCRHTDIQTYVCRHTRCLHTCLLEGSSQTPLSSYQWAAPRDYQRLNDAFVKKAPRKGSILLARCSLVGTRLNKCPKPPNKEAGAHSRIKGVHKGS